MKCPTCGAAMLELFTSWACSKECDLKNLAVKKVRQHPFSIEWARSMAPGTRLRVVAAHNQKSTIPVGATIIVARQRADDVELDKIRLQCEKLASGVGALWQPRNEEWWVFELE